MKKKNAQIQSLYPQIWGLEIWSRKTHQSAPYINPPFAFPAPKEKRKYISASARTVKNK
jgi:hypothetical protein